MQSNDRLPAHLRTARPNQAEQGEAQNGEEDRALPWGWVSGRPVYGVSFETPDGLHRSFRYMHLESDMTWKGDTIVMHFSGMKLFKVTIKGLRLEKLYYRLQDDRMRSVRQAVRDFNADDGEPHIGSITIDEIQPDE